jgi:excisionase family DNA binding protein
VNPRRARQCFLTQALLQSPDAHILGEPFRCSHARDRALLQTIRLQTKPYGSSRFALVARQGLLRFGNPAFSSPATAARWLEHLALVLRALEDDPSWQAAEAAAASRQRRREPGSAPPNGQLNGMNTMAEVAAFARVSLRSVQRAISRGDLDILRPGPRKVRISDEAVLRWLDGTAQG